MVRHFSVPLSNFAFTSVPALATASAAPPRVLIVVDREDKLPALVVELNQTGATTQASRSRDALERVARDTFDLVIIDLMLHGTNGVELSRTIHAAQPALPIVLTSEYTFSAWHLSRIASGAAGFLRRPFAQADIAAYRATRTPPRTDLTPASS